MLLFKALRLDFISKTGFRFAQLFIVDNLWLGAIVAHREVGFFNGGS